MKQDFGVESFSKLALAFKFYMLGNGRTLKLLKWVAGKNAILFALAGKIDYNNAKTFRKLLQ